MRVRSPRARMRLPALLCRLLGVSALSPRRFFAALRRRTQRSGAAGAAGTADDVADAAGGPLALSVDERAAVSAVWAPGPATQLLALAASGLQLTRHDLRTLRGSGWLNDEVSKAKQRVNKDARGLRGLRLR